MYRKEECLSLLKDPDDDIQDSERTPSLKWHKVNVVVLAKPTAKFLVCQYVVLVDSRT